MPPDARPASSSRRQREPTTSFLPNRARATGRGFHPSAPRRGRRSSRNSGVAITAPTSGALAQRSAPRFACVRSRSSRAKRGKPVSTIRSRRRGRAGATSSRTGTTSGPPGTPVRAPAAGHTRKGERRAGSVRAGTPAGSGATATSPRSTIQAGRFTVRVRGAQREACGKLRRCFEMPSWPCLASPFGPRDRAESRRLP